MVGRAWKKYPDTRAVSTVKVWPNAVDLSSSQYVSLLGTRASRSIALYSSPAVHAVVAQRGAHRGGRVLRYRSKNKFRPRSCTSVHERAGDPAFQTHCLTGGAQARPLAGTTECELSECCRTCFEHSMAACPDKTTCQVMLKLQVLNRIIYIMVFELLECRSQPHNSVCQFVRRKLAPASHPGDAAPSASVHKCCWAACIRHWRAAGCRPPRHAQWSSLHGCPCKLW
jgi:hypothetical protein